MRAPPSSINAEGKAGSGVDDNKRLALKSSWKKNGSREELRHKVLAFALRKRNEFYSELTKGQDEFCIQFINGPFCSFGIARA